MYPKLAGGDLSVRGSKRASNVFSLLQSVSFNEETRERAVKGGITIQAGAKSLHVSLYPANQVWMVTYDTYLLRNCPCNRSRFSHWTEPPFVCSIHSQLPLPLHSDPWRRCHRAPGNDTFSEPISARNSFSGCINTQAEQMMYFAYV